MKQESQGQERESKDARPEGRSEASMPPAHMSEIRRRHTLAYFAAGFCAVGVYAIVAACALKDGLSELPGADVSFGRVSLTSRPQSAPAEAVASVVRSLSKFEGRSPAEADLPQKAAAALQKNPWVSKVEFVRRAYPGRLEVAARIRHPVAAVEGKKTVLVDGLGVRLPECPNGTRERGLPVIRKVKGSAPAVGTRWEDKSLLSCLCVLDAVESVLQDQEIDTCIRSVFASSETGEAGRPGVTVETANGTTIVWGSSNREEDVPFGCLSNAVKKKELAKLLRRARAAGRPLLRADVRFAPGSFKLGGETPRGSG